MSMLDGYVKWSKSTNAKYTKLSKFHIHILLMNL